LSILLGVIILALLFGLPVAAFVTARRLPVPRRRAVRGDRSWELAREFRLVGADFTEVQLAVQQGRAASPARLRPALLPSRSTRSVSTPSAATVGPGCLGG